MDETDHFADRSLSSRSTNSQSESSIGQIALQTAIQIREAHVHLNFSFGARCDHLFSSSSTWSTSLRSYSIRTCLLTMLRNTQRLM